MANPCSLTDVRDQLAFAGVSNARELSHKLQASEPLVQAMLERLVLMQKAVQVQQPVTLSGQCKSCPQGKKCQSVPYYRLRDQSIV
mgnify:CR=1 FL=1